MKNAQLSTFAIFLASILIVSGMNLGYSQNSQPISTTDGRNIKTIAIVTLVDPDRTVPTQKPGIFSYIFEACAGSKDIINPEVIVTSDSESKKIKLSHNLKANSCQVSVSKIKSSSKDVISALVVERGGVTQIIKNLEMQIADVKQQLITEKTNLNNIAKEKPEPADFRKKISETTEKIVKLRMDLNELRQKYFRTLYLLNN